MSPKTVSPSTSYHLLVPSDVREENEGKVSSFWRDGEPLLLQLSSYLRQEGQQVEAVVRLRERVTKLRQSWSIWAKKIYLDPTVDQATAEWKDDRDLLWVHTYLVWPHLTVYATISGPEESVRNQDNWAEESLRSIRLVLH